MGRHDANRLLQIPAAELPMLSATLRSAFESPSKTRKPRAISLWPTWRQLGFGVLGVCVVLAFTPIPVLMQIGAYAYACSAFELAFLFMPRRKGCEYHVDDDPVGSEAFKVALATSSDNHHYAKNADWTEADNRLAERNKLRYAERQGYALRVVDFSELTERAGSWGKILLLRQLLQEFDIVAYMDSDVAILNQDIRLEELLGREKDIAVTSDLGGINAGSIVVRNTTWSRWFLDELWSQAWLEHMNHVPFKWDQRAFHYLLQTPKWVGNTVGSMIPYPVPREEERHVCNVVVSNSDRALCPKAKTVELSEEENLQRTSEDMLSHIRVLPQCSMNSNLRWLFSDASWETWQTAQYIPGDFVIHAAGYRYAFKSAVFHVSLLQAEYIGRHAQLFAFAALLSPFLVLLGGCCLVRYLQSRAEWLRRSPAERELERSLIVL